MAAIADFSPAELDLRLTRGDAISFPVTIRENGALVDVINRRYRAQIRETADSTAIIATFMIDVSGGRATPVGITGVIIVALPAIVTVSLGGKLVWDLEDLTIQRTLIRGAVVVDPDVSRP